MYWSRAAKNTHELFINKLILANSFKMQCLTTITAETFKLVWKLCLTSDYFGMKKNPFEATFPVTIEQLGFNSTGL